MTHLRARLGVLPALPLPFSLRMLAALALVAASAGTASAQEAKGADGAAYEPLARIILYSPPAGQTALGTVEFHADVFSAYEIREVRLRVDGEEVVTFQEPPYRIAVPLGDRNREHRFEVIVLGHELELARLVRVTPAYRIDDEVNLGLRQLYVTVTRAGERVLDLEREDFSILDAGEGQQIVTFEGGDAALAASILVDASTSMHGERLVAAVAGVRAFIAGMHELDEASLTLFSDHILLESEWSSDLSPYDTELAALEAGGGTALNDHLFLALERLEARQGRRVIIVLSDGLDVDSVLSMSEVRWMARRSQSIIYWIRLDERRSAEPPSVITPWRSSAEHRQEVTDLQESVIESGGSIVTIAQTSEAGQAFEEILRELREQYVLGYYPNVEFDDGRWRPVTVKVEGSGLKVRTRDGYLDY